RVPTTKTSSTTGRRTREVRARIRGRCEKRDSVNLVTLGPDNLIFLKREGRQLCCRTEPPCELEASEPSAANNSQRRAQRKHLVHCTVFTLEKPPAIGKNGKILSA